jgi:hypothetical protein
MPSPEFSPQPSQNPNIDIILPYEVDDDWCADFNRDHGRRGHRAIVNTYAAVRQVRPLFRCDRQGPSKRFYQDDFGEVPEHGLFFDGEVLDARLVPIWDRFSEEYEYVLHLGMKDVVDAEGVRTFAAPHEEVWVPLTENGDRLVMYQ